MRIKPILRAALALAGAFSLTACGSAEAPDKAAAARPQAPAPTAASAAATGDALVPGTDYHATAPLPCSFGEGAAMAQCDAGVKRKWGEDGTTLVEISKPDGRKRAIFFRGTTAYGADSAQADGSAGWEFKVTREGDESTIVYGPERYVIPDVLVIGD